MSALARGRDRLARRVAELARAASGAPAPARLVFVHIPKTAGSSVNAHFKHHLGSAWSGRAVGLNAAAGIDERRLARARRAAFVFGHFGWRTLEEVRGDAFAFTVLRDPAERLLSLYRFARRRELPSGSGFAPLMEAARSADFAGFCLSDDARVRPFLDNAQARTLAAGYLVEECGFDDGEAILELARAHLAALDFVALTETLDADFAALAGQAGLPPPRAGLHRNVGEPAPASVGLEEARAILGERIALDQALYGFARALRAERMEALEPLRSGLRAAKREAGHAVPAGNAGSPPALARQEAWTMDQQDRERSMEELAGQLLFRVEKHGPRYSLCRDVDVSSPVRRDNLTLDEAEELLNTWKMRGFHGG